MVTKKGFSIKNKLKNKMLLKNDSNEEFIVELKFNIKTIDLIKKLNELIKLNNRQHQNFNSSSSSSSNGTIIQNESSIKINYLKLSLYNNVINLIITYRYFFVILVSLLLLLIIMFVLVNLIYIRKSKKNAKRIKLMETKKKNQSFDVIDENSYRTSANNNNISNNNNKKIVNKSFGSTKEFKLFTRTTSFELSNDYQFEKFTQSNNRIDSLEPKNVNCENPYEIPYIESNNDENYNVSKFQTFTTAKKSSSLLPTDIKLKQKPDRSIQLKEIFKQQQQKPKNSDLYQIRTVPVCFIDSDLTSNDSNQEF
jgi:hypothetical protein